MRVVDLSHPVRTGMQVFPGDPHVRTRTAATVAQDGFRVAELHLGTHSGTHVDAPSHTVEGGADVDALELSSLVGPARVVDVPGCAAGRVVRWADVAGQLERLAPGTIVLFRTGWSAHFGTEHYLEHPVLDPEIARRLVAAGVRTLGVDTLNPDPTPTADATDPVALPVHEVVLGAGGAIVENLTGLAAVDRPGAVFAALPLRLAGLDGSPVRAVAMWPDAAEDGDPAGR
ncbi:cyclase family protein [Kocuria sp. SM24M-10]|uniref:cyclase family protein n=1 Tax=Kocuria sp. SM24M-10 TaxID=1660349 RepID=UPI00064A2B33|nr:cyclase family protein [Kocuria sp. SM24M-10]KLU11128.1 hypothetical protein ABL57_02790 [Kocuria sp. SM24M-10]